MLTVSAKRKLRQNAHHLKPVVMIGQHGVTPAVIAEIDRALTDHELIKVRYRGAGSEERKHEFAQIAKQLSAAVVHSIGGITVLYRESTE